MSNYKQGLISFFREVYNIKSHYFLLINLFCLVILFFVLDDKTGGSFTVRVLTFFICTLIGGLYGLFLSRKRNGAKSYWFKLGAGALLTMTMLLAWSNNKGYYTTNVDCSDDASNYNEGYSNGRIVSHAFDAGSISCNDWIDDMGNEGIYYKDSDCFCNGFYDGKSNKTNIYK